jgi:UDP-glucose 4-epimerase
VVALGLDPATVEFHYSGGHRGWAGDVPVVRLDCRRIQGLGWTCRLGSRQAIRLSLKALIEDARIAGA